MAVLPFLFVCGRADLVNRLLINLVIASVIAVYDILVVIKFVDVALPCAVVPLDAGKNPLVLNDTLGDRSTTASTVVIVDDKIG